MDIIIFYNSPANRECSRVKMSMQSQPNITAKRVTDRPVHRV